LSHEACLPRRETISHRVHKRLEISNIEAVDGEWYAEVLAWKMDQLAWEELLRAPNRGELTFGNIGVKHGAQE
jgi:hypothetical protein